MDTGKVKRAVATKRRIKRRQAKARLPETREEVIERLMNLKIAGITPAEYARQLARLDDETYH